jgi:soluble lytic murein transglycosylase-like protein
VNYLVAALLICAGYSLSAVGQKAPETGHDDVVYYADAYAAHYQVPRELVHAVITQESRWNPKAVSPKGAMGVMQLMPGTAAAYGVRDPFDISENISGGVQYLAMLMQQFNGDLRLVLAAYYCGSRPILRRGLHYSDADVYAYVASIRRLYLAEIALHNTPATLVVPGGDQQ